MAGAAGDGDGTPKDFNECVSQEQLQAAVEKAQQGMNEAITKAVTDALNGLNIGATMERLDRRISMLADKATELDNRMATNDDAPEESVYDSNGNIDQAAIRLA